MLISKTKSLCPECFAVIDARIVSDEERVVMRKTCEEHGSFEALLWNGSAESYEEWVMLAGEPVAHHPSQAHVDSCTCPFSCGLCTLHESQTFTAALMVTQQCNLACPVCFTQPDCKASQPTFDELCRKIDFFLETYGEPYPLEFCGGEPTVREDLPALAEYARGKGFSHIQMNTNGVRLGRDAEYAKELARSGITTAYLGFDSLRDDVYIKTCGAGLVADKLAAVENCFRVGIGVVLVPTLIAGVNDGEIGDILEYAIDSIPAVKGVNFQPLGRLGILSEEAAVSERITIPDVLAAIELQTHGRLKQVDFMPPGVEHHLCSFSALYLKGANDVIVALSRRKPREDNVDAAQKVRSVMPLQWKAGSAGTLTVGGMLFQDVYNVDLDRLRRCPTHIIGDGKLYPLCAKYLTSDSGGRLYEGID